MATKKKTTAKRPVGRPIEWTPQRIEALRVKFLQYIKDTEIPIIAEFAYLNGTYRQLLYDLPEFSDAIKLCISKKESALEKKGLTGEVNTTMAIFSLKQLGWKDKQEVDTTHHLHWESELDGDPDE